MWHSKRTINPVQWTRPLNVHMYVKMFRSESWPRTAYMLLQYVSTAWYLMYGMMDRALHQMQSNTLFFFNRLN